MSSKLDRLKSLLRLSQSSEPEEAAQAMKAAAKLAAELDVDIQSLSESTLGIHHLDYPSSSRLSTESRQAWITLQAFFEVTLCHSQRKVTIIGQEHRCQIAVNVYEYLLASSRRCLAAWKATEKANKRRITEAKTRGFKLGFFIGIRYNLTAEKRQQQQQTDLPGLVAHSEADRLAYLAALYPNAQAPKKNKTKTNSNAVTNGFMQGRSTAIRPTLRTTLALEN